MPDADYIAHPPVVLPDPPLIVSFPVVVVEGFFATLKMTI
jgi:hypothetical protein